MLSRVPKAPLAAVLKRRLATEVFRSQGRNVLVHRRGDKVSVSLSGGPEAASTDISAHDSAEGVGEGQRWSDLSALHRRQVDSFLHRSQVTVGVIIPPYTRSFASASKFGGGSLTRDIRGKKRIEEERWVRQHEADQKQDARAEQGRRIEETASHPKGDVLDIEHDLSDEIEEEKSRFYESKIKPERERFNTSHAKPTKANTAGRNFSSLVEHPSDPPYHHNLYDQNSTSSNEAPADEPGGEGQASALASSKEQDVDVLDKERECHRNPVRHTNSNKGGTPSRITKMLHLKSGERRGFCTSLNDARTPAQVLTDLLKKRADESLEWQILTGSLTDSDKFFVPPIVETIPQLDEDNEDDIDDEPEVTSRRFAKASERK